MMKKLVAVMFALFAMMSINAFAVLPASVGTSITAIQTDGQGVFDLVFPVVAAMVGLAVVIKLFKRFTSKV